MCVFGTECELDLEVESVVSVAWFCCTLVTIFRDSEMTGIISIVKPTRCTNISNLFYFGMTLYMFRTVFPSIVRS